MHYLDILFEKSKTCGSPKVELDEEGAHGVGEFIQGRITRNGRHDLLQIWKDLDSHGMSHKRSLVWKIHEGVQGKYGRDKETRLWNHICGGLNSDGDMGRRI